MKRKSWKEIEKEFDKRFASMTVGSDRPNDVWVAEGWFEDENGKLSGGLKELKSFFKSKFSLLEEETEKKWKKAWKEYTESFKRWHNNVVKELEEELRGEVSKIAEDLRTMDSSWEGDLEKHNNAVLKLLNFKLQSLKRRKK